MTTRALLLLLPGLGDALCAGPILSAALSRDDWSLDILTMLDPVAEYATALDGVDNVYSTHLLERFEFRRLLSLRRNCYDKIIVPFPATRWQYAALASALGASQLWIHDYGGTSKAIAVLAGARFVRLMGGHRLAENVRLARAMGLNSADELCYVVPAAWRAPRQNRLVGVHSGSMVYKGNEARRWPIQNFAELVKRLIGRGLAVRTFFGPSEADDSSLIASMAGSPSLEIVRDNLANAARALAECEVFVGNDAGFSHLAAGLGCKTVVVFGMTDPARAVPAGRTIALRPSPCPACHDEGMRAFTCVRHIGYRCVRTDVSVETVLGAVLRALESEVQNAALATSGAFRLYNRARGTSRKA